MTSDSNIALRRLNIGDADFFLEVENDPIVWAFSSYTDAPYSRSEVEAFIIESLADSLIENKPKRQLRLVITHNQTSIGFIDLYNIDYLESAASVAIIIYSKSLRSKGYGSEALSLIEKFCLERLNISKLIAEVDPNNIPAKLFFEKLGFCEVSKNDGFYILVKVI